MNLKLKRFLAVWITAIVIFVESTPIISFAAPSTYSKTSNSGTRDEVCTSLSGTSASSYYTGNYTYDTLDDLSSTELFSSLQTLMRSTHTYKSAYDDCHYKADKTDCEENNGKVTLIYTSYQATMNQWNGWNREHVWPKSLAGNTQDDGTGGADLHHIRPSDAVVNSTRNNHKYGNTNGGGEVYGRTPASGCLGGYYANGYFEPLDHVKGDVARICLYVYVRWNSDWGASSITQVFQSVDVLLEWCALDPVDTWEMGRNEVIQNIQGNRNVFIDYPELAWLIFDRDIPNTMTTPSGEAKNATSSGNGGTGDSGNPGTTPDPTPSTVYNLTTALNDGDKVVIGAPAYGKALSVQKANSNSYYNKGVDYTTSNFDNITDDEIFTVKVNSDGSYTFTSVSGTVIALSDQYTSLNATGANKCWTLEEQSGKPGVFYVKNTVRGNYLEWYDANNYWSAYTTAGSDMFEISFYLVEAAQSGGTGGDSGNTGGGTIPDPSCPHSSTKLVGAYAADCGNDGYTGDTHCASCNELISEGEAIPKTGNHSWSDWTKVQGEIYEIRICSVCDDEQSCSHQTYKTQNVSQANCGEPGYSGDRYCASCSKLLLSGKPTPPTGKHSFGEWQANSTDKNEIRTCAECKTTETRACTHAQSHLVGQKDAGCLNDGSTGDSYCNNCNVLIAKGESIPSTGHIYGEETVFEEPTEDDFGLTRKVCEVCGNDEFTAIPKLEKENNTGKTVAIVSTASVGGVSVSALAVFFILKKFVFR